MKPVTEPVTVNVARAVRAPESAGPLLDHERLHVYQLALQYHAQVMKLVPKRGCRILREQLERSSLSIIDNIAEGAGRTALKVKQQHYEVARGSSTESAATVDALWVRGIASKAQRDAARTTAIRLVQMLSKLCGPPR